MQDPEPEPGPEPGPVNEVEALLKMKELQEKVSATTTRRWWRCVESCVANGCRRRSTVCLQRCARTRTFVEKVTWLELQVEKRGRGKRGRDDDKRSLANQESKDENAPDAESTLLLDPRFSLV